MSEEEKTWYNLHFAEREILRFLYLNSSRTSEEITLNEYKEDYILKQLTLLHLKGYVVSSRAKPVARLTTDGRYLVERVTGTDM